MSDKKHRRCIDNLPCDRPNCSGDGCERFPGVARGDYKPPLKARLDANVSAGPDSGPKATDGKAHTLPPKAK